MGTKQDIFQDRFIKPVEKTGKYTILTAVVCLFIPGTYLWIFHGLMPPLDVLMRAVFGAWSFAIVFSIVEPIIYFSLIGFGGTYMAFLSGNLVNLRLPISITVQEVVGTREGTPEAEIISTIGVAGSLISSQTVLTIGVLLFLPFLSKIDSSAPAVSAALDHVLPALFGALAGMFIFKNYKLGIIPLGVGIILALISTKLPYSYTIPALVVISVVSARFMYKKGWIEVK